MADRYWVGVDGNWHDANNWASSSGGAGGAGVPTSVDNVFLDGNGYALCWPTSDIACNNFTMTAAATEMFILDANGVMHGDFSMAAGYWGITGGPDHVFEFKGNWLNTGGTFAIGTGVGVDPECIFSGVGKTYQLNNPSAATFQNVTISGEYIFTGTRLSVANVYQTFKVTGILEIQANGATICDVRINGNNATIEIIGEVKGDGRMLYVYDDTSTLSNEGVISVKYFKFDLTGSVMTLPPIQFEETCTVEVEYQENNQVFRFAAGIHYLLGNLLLYCDEAGVTSAEIDFGTNKANVFIGNIFKVGSASEFPNATLNVRLGHSSFENVVVVRGSIQFYFSYSSATAHLNVIPGNSILIIWPKTSGGIILFPTYRLSRVYSGGMDYETYNKVVFFTKAFETQAGRFVEGFGCKELIVESYAASWQLRHDNVNPQMLYIMDKLKVIGNIINDPRIMASKSLNPSGVGFQVNNEQDVFNVNMSNIKASYGIEIENYNGVVSGTLGNNIVVYDRNVQSIGGRNVLDERNCLTSTPPPESIVEQMVEVF